MCIKLIAYLILTVSGLTLFKVGGEANQLVLNINKLELNLSITSLIGIICYGCSFLLWLSIIKENELSYIFPIVNGIVTITTVFSGMIIFHENIQGMQWLGIICIILGSLLVNIYK